MPKKLIEKGVVFSASVMFACPWYQEAVDILKAHPDRVSQHRQAELKALLSKAFRKAIKKKKIKLITYRDVASEMGLEAMKKPRK